MREFVREKGVKKNISIIMMKFSSLKNTFSTQIICLFRTFLLFKLLFNISPFTKTLYSRALDG